MRLLKHARVPLSILGLSLIAVHLSNATPAPRLAMQAGTQPTYFVEHADHIQAGLTFQSRWAQLVNPYEGDAARIAEPAGGRNSRSPLRSRISSAPPS